MTTTSKKRANYDTPWKNILAIYFRAFLDLCFPEIAEDIDWTQPLEFLDKELRAMSKDLEDRQADLLVKFWLKSGTLCAALIHIEQQNDKQNGFEERVFIYRIRIFDQYRLPLASIIILTDKNKNWRPNNYCSEIWNNKIETNFTVLKIIDYEEKR